MLLGTHVPLLAPLSFLRALTDFWVVRALIFGLDIFANANICPVPRIVIGNSRARRKQGLRQTSEVLGAAVSSLRLTAPKQQYQSPLKSLSIRQVKAGSEDVPRMFSMLDTAPFLGALVKTSDGRVIRHPVVGGQIPGAIRVHGANVIRLRHRKTYYVKSPATVDTCMGSV